MTRYRSSRWTQLFQLISTVLLPGENYYDTHMVMYTSACGSAVSLSRNIKTNMSNTERKHVAIDENTKKRQVNQSVQN